MIAEDTEKLQKFPGQPRDANGRFGSGGSEPTKDEIAEGMKTPRFQSLLAGNRPGSMPVASIDKELSSALGADTKTILLSRDTVKKNRAHHPEVPEDLWRDTQVETRRRASSIRELVAAISSRWR